MGDTFKQSMTKTMSDFNEKVLPILNRDYPNMKFVEVEGNVNNEIADDFDRYAGIDIYRVRPEVGEMIGIASRIQRGRVWRSFTVRKERKSGSLTEYEKRKQAIKKKSLYPLLTMQAYIEERTNNVVIGLVRTEDLIDFIEKYNPKTKKTGADKIGQASFYTCYWDALIEHGYKVVVLEGKYGDENEIQNQCVKHS